MEEIWKDIIREIRHLIEIGLSDLEISKIFNVCRDNIGYIRRGQTWGWGV